MSLSRRSATLAMLAGATSALSFGRAFADPDPTPAPDLAPPEDEPPTSLGAASDPFEHMIAPVGINGQGPFHFLIDTGANVSCISRSLADKLMLAPAEPARVHTAVGVHTRPSVMIDVLDVGARKRKKVRAPALPNMGPLLDGVLGVDWLGGQRLALDFKKNLMEITSSRAEFSTPTHVVVPAKRRMGQLTIVDADLSGRPISAMIDSGSQTTICNTRLREMVGDLERRHAPVTDHQIIKMETLLGEVFSGELFYVPFLRLGGLDLGNVPVVFADTHIFELWNLKHQPALVLGMDLLKQFDAVALDYGRSRVRFDLARGFAA